MRDIERKLVAELISNCRRSDRELAEAMGSSQPTVTRLRTKIEREGMVREYTTIPDFANLGFEIMSISFFKLRRPLDDRRVSEARKMARGELRESPIALAFVLHGLGMGADRVTVAFHRNYTEYSEFVRRIEQYSDIVVDHVRSFIVNLRHRDHFLPFTMTSITEYLRWITDETTSEKQIQGKKKTKT